MSLPNFQYICTLSERDVGHAGRKEEMRDAYGFVIKSKKEITWEFKE
jgi:hypothetical protein